MNNAGQHTVLCVAFWSILVLQHVTRFRKMATFCLTDNTYGALYNKMSLCISE